MLIPELIDLEVTIDEAIEWLEDEYAGYTQSRKYFEKKYYKLDKYDYKNFSKIEEYGNATVEFARKQIITRMAITALKTIQAYAHPADAQVMFENFETERQKLINYTEKRLHEAKSGIKDPSRIDELEKMIEWMLSEKEGNNNE